MGSLTKTKVTIILLALLSIAFGGANPIQAQSSSWVKTYLWPGESYSYANSVVQTLDGNGDSNGYAVAGWTDSLISGATSSWVAKLDDYGNVQWQHTYGGASVAKAIQQTADGGFIVAGWSGSSVMVLKLDSLGTVTWQYTYLAGFAWRVRQTTDLGYVVVGYSGTTSPHAWVLKLNSDGTVAWGRDYAGAYARDVQQNSDGGCLVVGSTESTGNDAAWLLNLDSGGSKIWENTVGGLNSGSSHAYAVVKISDGGYAVAGDIAAYGGIRAWMFTFSVKGSGPEGFRDVSFKPGTFTSVEVAYADSIQQTSDNGFILSGWGYPYTTGCSDAWVLKLDDTTMYTWMRGYGLHTSDPSCWTGNTQSFSVQQTLDGGYVMAGATYAGSGVAELVKLDSDGDVGISTCGYLYDNLPTVNWDWMFGSNAEITTSVALPSTNLTLAPQIRTTAMAAASVEPTQICYSGDPAVLSVNPASLSFTGTQGCGNPPSQDIEINNTGGSILNWYATPSVSWLTVNPATGVNNGTLAVSVDISSGSQTGSVTIDSYPPAEGSPFTLPVTLTVNTFEVTNPVYGTSIPSMSQVAITWASAPCAATKFTVSYSTNNGSKWTTIAKNATGSSLMWVTPRTRKDLTTCLVRITGYASSGKTVVGQATSGVFTISAK
jgi:hypothetical protein